MENQPIITTPAEGSTNAPVPRTRQNTAERQCIEQLLQDGWEVTRRGWPDFVAFKDLRMIVVEVKPKRSRRLKRTQHRLMVQLAKRGIECYRWDPESGYIRIMPGSKRIPPPITSQP